MNTEINRRVALIAIAVLFVAVAQSSVYGQGKDEVITLSNGDREITSATTLYGKGGKEVTRVPRFGFNRTRIVYDSCRTIREREKEVGRDSIETEYFDEQGKSILFYEIKGSEKTIFAGNHIVSEKQAQEIREKSYAAEKPCDLLGKSCLRGRFPNLKNITPTSAYDAESDRSFDWIAKDNVWKDAKTGECICPDCAPELPECKRPLTETGAIVCIERLIALVQKAYDARQLELGERPYFIACKARMKRIFDDVGVPKESNFVEFWASVCNSWDYTSHFYQNHIANLKGSITNIKATHKFKESDISYLESGVDVWFRNEHSLIELMDDRWAHLRFSGEYQKSWKEAVKKTAASKSEAERKNAGIEEKRAYNLDLGYYDVIKQDNADIKAYGDQTLFTTIPRK